MYFTPFGWISIITKLITPRLTVLLCQISSRVPFYQRGGVVDQSPEPGYPKDLEVTVPEAPRSCNSRSGFLNEEGFCKRSIALLQSIREMCATKTSHRRHCQCAVESHNQVEELANIYGHYFLRTPPQPVNCGSLTPKLSGSVGQLLVWVLEGFVVKLKRALCGLSL